MEQRTFSRTAMTSGLLFFLEKDKRTDTYTCHAGKKLQPIFLKKQTSKSGYESKVTVYECEDCTDCPYKEKSTKAKGNRRLYVSKTF